MWSWKRRIERAEELADIYPFAEQVLRFYRQIADFQSKAAERFSDLKLSLGGDLPASDLIPYFQDFLSLIAAYGPENLALASQDLAARERPEWEQLLAHYWRWHEVPDRGESYCLAFLAKAFLQPYAEILFEGLRDSEKLDKLGLPPFCPLCGGRPQVGCLRTEGEGAKRTLICSLCATEWRYQRVRCPECAETRAQMLSCYSAEGFDHIRLETCQSCRFYLKVIDLTKNGLAVPVVDDLASMPLDLWAREQCYMKREPNMAGI